MLKTNFAQFHAGEAKGGDRKSPGQVSEELLRDPDIKRDWTARLSCGEQQVKKEFLVLTREKKLSAREKSKAELASGKAKTSKTATVTTTSTSIEQQSTVPNISAAIASSLGLSESLVVLDTISDDN